MECDESLAFVQYSFPPQANGTSTRNWNPVGWPVFAPIQSGTGASEAARDSTRSIVPSASVVFFATRNRSAPRSPFGSPNSRSQSPSAIGCRYDQQFSVVPSPPQGVELCNHAVGLVPGVALVDKSSSEAFVFTGSVLTFTLIQFLPVAPCASQRLSVTPNASHVDGSVNDELSDFNPPLL